MNAIVAVNNLGYIGKDGKLMWRSSDDFKHFVSKTTGHICIVGGKTFRDDLNCKPLKNRIMIVVGRTPDDLLPPERSNGSIFFYPTLWEAVQSAIRIQDNYKKEIWLIGGESLYDQLFPLITELHVSIINDDQVGDKVLAIPPNFRGKVITYRFEPNKKETN